MFLSAANGRIAVDFSSPEEEGHRWLWIYAPSGLRPRGSTGDYWTFPHLIDTINRYTQGVLVGTRGGGGVPLANNSLPNSRSLPISCLQLSHRHPHMRSPYRIHQFFSLISEDVHVFFHFRSFLPFLFFLVLPWWSNDPWVENLLLAIDQHPVCPNAVPAWTLTSEMVPFGSKSVSQSMLIDEGENLHGFECSNWPLTSEMFTFFLERLANGCVWKLSFGACVCHVRPAGPPALRSSC